MLVGVPKEIKDNEYRVGTVPSTVRELTEKGHQVVVETLAGAGAGFRIPIIAPRAPRSCRMLTQYSAELN